ncbi:MAG: hypothetical protein IPK26_11295 [Planctomycetes bacterium]|nr:hypothetical protein [Planctomycetota bacterium]
MQQRAWWSYVLACVPVLGHGQAQIEVEIQQMPKAQVPAAQAGRHERGGDLDKIEWLRPFGAAQQRARERKRLLLVKPILGGSNAADPSGVPCGGKNDCEGSW